jgi:ubiquinone/menaquinone biosynthesis C-methylase UbiE
MDEMSPAATDRIRDSRADARSMRLKNAAVTDVLDRAEVYRRLLRLADARVLELGCGAAELTREIATHAPGVSITALEVDRTQHEKNLRIAELPNVTFRVGGAEAIPAPDESFDIVLMFRSLHHVPVASMDEALREIRRVLKPGGLAYFEEPVFDGEYSEMVRVFHDEQFVREQAFMALQRAVSSGLMELVTERFFLTEKRFRDWAQFEGKVLQETHTEHRLTHEQWEATRKRFMRAATHEGALFTIPMRVDLLRRQEEP